MAVMHNDIPEERHRQNEAQKLEEKYKKTAECMLRLYLDQEPTKATAQQDMEFHTDYVMEDGSGVAYRTRNLSFRDLTLRYWHYKTGHNTEFRKIIREGHNKWYITLWLADNGNVTEFMLVDLDEVRRCFKEGVFKETQDRVQPMGNTKFYWLTREELEDNGCIFKQWKK